MNPMKNEQDETQQNDNHLWAIVELMGHVKLAGKLTEVEKFGVKMGRIDIPDGEGFVTQFFGGHSVYRITYVSEEVSRHVNKTNKSVPVSVWDFPKQISAKVENQDDEIPFQ